MDWNMHMTWRGTNPKHRKNIWYAKNNELNIASYTSEQYTKKDVKLQFQEREKCKNMYIQQEARTQNLYKEMNTYRIGGKLSGIKYLWFIDKNMEKKWHQLIADRPELEQETIKHRRDYKAKEVINKV